MGNAILHTDLEMATDLTVASCWNSTYHWYQLVWTCMQLHHGFADRPYNQYRWNGKHFSAETSLCNNNRDTFFQTSLQFWKGHYEHTGDFAATDFTNGSNDSYVCPSTWIAGREIWVGVKAGHVLSIWTDPYIGTAFFAWGNSAWSPSTPHNEGDVWRGTSRGWFGTSKRLDETDYSTQQGKKTKTTAGTFGSSLGFTSFISFWQSFQKGKIQFPWLLLQLRGVAKLRPDLRSQVRAPNMRSWGHRWLWQLQWFSCKCSPRSLGFHDPMWRAYYSNGQLNPPTRRLILLLQFLVGNICSDSAH